MGVFCTKLCRKFRATRLIKFCEKVLLKKCENLDGTKNSIFKSNWKREMVQMVKLQRGIWRLQLHHIESRIDAVTHVHSCVKFMHWSVNKSFRFKLLFIHIHDSHYTYINIITALNGMVHADSESKIYKIVTMNF